MKYKKEDLENLILVEKLSYEEIGRIYHVSGAAIKKAALRMDIKLESRRKINEKETFNKGITKFNKEICSICGKEYIKYPGKHSDFCSNECYIINKHKELYKKILNGDSYVMRANYSPHHFKKDIINEQNGVCAICGMSQEWNGKELVFILDHIDGNAANNRRDNLRCICPNCDSQLDTFKSKNKNGARSYYRYHKYNVNNEKNIDKKNC